MLTNKKQEAGDNWACTTDNRVRQKNMLGWGGEGEKGRAMCYFTFPWNDNPRDNNTMQQVKDKTDEERICGQGVVPLRFGLDLDAKHPKDA